MTIVEKILLAARDLEGEKNGSFTAEDLIVKAWELDRDAFGLQGYADRFPDSNRILTNIMGTKGLRGRNWIEKLGEKTYRLTATGRFAARSLLDKEQGSDRGASVLTRTYIEIAERMLASSAFKIGAEDPRSDEIIFPDACKFWGISSYSSAASLRARMAEIDELLGLLREAVSRSPTGTVFLPGSRFVIDASTAARLQALNDVLKQRFSQELDAIGRRTDDRKA